MKGAMLWTPCSPGNAIGWDYLLLVSICYITRYLIIYLKMTFLLILGLRRTYLTEAFSSRNVLSDWCLSLGRKPPFESSCPVLIPQMSISMLLLALLKFMRCSLLWNTNRLELWFVKSKLWHKLQEEMYNLEMQIQVLGSIEENKG